MAYLIGAILVLLLIALVFVFRPPKKISEEGEAAQEDTGTDEQLGFDTAVAEGDEETEEGVLTLDESEDFDQAETGGHEEEELELTFEKPGPDQAGTDDFGEELELDLEEGFTESTEEEAVFELDAVAELSDEPVQPVDEEKTDEEAIPFIVEEGESSEEGGEFSPALGDVPDDYSEQLAEEEAPEELAERLDSFLGTDEEGEKAEEDLVEQEASVEDEEPAEETKEALEQDLEETSGLQDEEVETESFAIDIEGTDQPEVIEEELADKTGEDAEQETPEEGSAESETLADSTEPVSEEEISFVEEGEPLSSDEDITPALGDVPDDYRQELDEEEAPEELAERLDFFLGTGDEEEQLQETEEPVSEDFDTDAEAEQPGEENELIAAEEVSEAEPAAETGPDAYSSFLARQEETLRHAMEEAIQNRETGKISQLSMALETLCTKQADISQSFQVHQQMLDAIDGLLNEVQQTLPGFQSETVRASLKKGDYDVVKTMLSEAVDQLGDNSQVAANLLYLWGRFEEERGELATARDLFDRACSTDSDNMDSIFSAGRLARISGDFEKAQSLLEERVQTGTEKGEDGIGLARARFELAKTLAALDMDTEKVEQLLQQSLETVEKTLGSTNPNLGPILHELAALNESAGRYELAEPLYKRSLEVVEQTLGSDSPRLGLTLAKLAGLYEEKEKQGEAESLYNRALEIRQKVLGENHPDIGSILGHLANILKAKGHYDQAEPLYKRSLEIAEITLGKEHPNLAMVYNEMFELYSEMGNEEKAEYYQEKAFSAFGMPGLGDGFVEMEKDTGHDEDEDDDQQIAGN